MFVTKIISWPAVELCHHLTALELIEARKQQIVQKARIAADPRNKITFTPQGTPNPNPTRTQVLRAAGSQSMLDSLLIDGRHR